MIVCLPRNIRVDTNNVPVDFENMILKVFKEYTAATNPVYMYQDKLAFIDRCAECLHKADDEYDAVKGLIKEHMEWEIDEHGDIPDKDDFWSMDFFCQCYLAGKSDANLYGHYRKNRRDDDKIMELLCRVIKVVMNYEEADHDER